MCRRFAFILFAMHLVLVSFAGVSSQEVQDGLSPDVEWRLIVALSRYCGLRCPSEHLSLKWGDIDWEHNRVTIPSPKTEHQADGESRVIPLFPELRPHLEALFFDEERVGTEHIITRYRDRNANLRTQLLRIIKGAGVKPWPKLVHNLRASRQTELTARFPLHVVCEWIGNSAPIADKHYLQVTDDHYSDAVETVTSEVRGTESGTADAESGTDSGTAICRTIALRLARNEKSPGIPGCLDAYCVGVRLNARQSSTP